MMTLAYSGLKPSQASLYVDDLLVIGCSENHMIKNLTNVFNLCRKHNIKLHPEKCSFSRHEVTFSGHKFTIKGILPDDKKYDAITKYPVPSDADASRRFGGLLLVHINRLRPCRNNIVERSLINSK